MRAAAVALTVLPPQEAIRALFEYLRPAFGAASAPTFTGICTEVCIGICKAVRFNLRPLLYAHSFVVAVLSMSSLLLKAY
jgi:hypothetical protein